MCNMVEDCGQTLKMKGISLELAWITSSLVTGDTEKFSSLYHTHKGAGNVCGQAVADSVSQFTGFL